MYRKMPRGKKNKRKNNEDILTTKLMQISLKMDDHIYCNKPISASAAERYLRDIASLKLKCPRTNVRALQVIEKLTRCMKSIISEAQSNASHSELFDQAYTEFPETCSPVYSLADEDRTEVFTAVSTIDNDPIIYLTEDNNETKTSQEQENLIQNVNNAITNMVIQDTQTLDEDYSQSILESFQNENAVCNEINGQTDIYSVHAPNNQPLVSNLTATANNEPQGTILNPNTICVEDCLESVKDTFNNENTVCIDATQEREFEEDRHITNSNVVTEPLVINRISNTMPMNDTLFTTNPLSHGETEMLLEIDSSNLVDLNTESAMKSQSKPPSLESKKETKAIVRRKKNKDNKNVKEKQKSQAKVKNTTQTSNKERHVNKVTKARKIDIVKKPINSEISVKKPEMTIYNKNVENDLSWVENLRYVRERGPEENDPNLSILEDDFWDNFSLPQQWNDLDFVT